MEIFCATSLSEHYRKKHENINCNASVDLPYSNTKIFLHSWSLIQNLKLLWSKLLVHGGWRFEKVHIWIYFCHSSIMSRCLFSLVWLFKALLPILEMFMLDLHSLHQANDGSPGTFAIHHWKIRSVSQISLNVDTECLFYPFCINFYTKSKEK